jgi:hypothetical protein
VIAGNASRNRRNPTGSQASRLTGAIRLRHRLLFC